VTTQPLESLGGVLASARVLNLTTKCYLKVRQAEGRIEHCVSEWVVQGKSIRDLNLAQIVQKRSIVAKQSEPIAWSELPGLIYQPAPLNLASTRQSYAILKQANQFCLEHA